MGQHVRLRLHSEPSELELVHGQESTCVVALKKTVVVLVHSRNAMPAQPQAMSIDQSQKGSG